MPRLDGTGPRGLGAGTKRGAGAATIPQLRTHVKDEEKMLQARLDEINKRLKELE